jgi:hypothetical protein
LTSGERYPTVASAVARLGGKQIQENGGYNLTALVPVYLRPAEAELKTTNRRNHVKEILNYVDKNTAVS